MEAEQMNEAQAEQMQEGDEEMQVSKVTACSQSLSYARFESYVVHGRLFYVGTTCWNQMIIIY